MPTLTRLIIVFLVIGVAIYGSMLALVTWVTPVTADLVIDIPAEQLKPRPWPFKRPAESSAVSADNKTDTPSQSQTGGSSAP